MLKLGNLRIATDTEAKNCFSNSFAVANDYNLARNDSKAVTVAVAFSCQQIKLLKADKFLRK